VEHEDHPKTEGGGKKHNDMSPGQYPTPSPAIDTKALLIHFHLSPESYPGDDIRLAATDNEFQVAKFKLQGITSCVSFTSEKWVDNITQYLMSVTVDSLISYPQLCVYIYSVLDIGHIINETKWKAELTPDLMCIIFMVSLDG
jgi:hypothetical protein